MKRIFPGILAVLLLLISQPVFAASVTLRAGTVEGAAVSTVEIPIEVAGATGLGALQWEVVFDPAVLTADTVTQGKQASKALVESRKDTPGRLFIALASSEDVNGDGPVAVAKFKVIGAQGQSSNLAIENANAWEGKTLWAVQVNPAAGKFTIGGLPWWLPWLLLALGILLLLLILILLLTRRRKPKAAAAAPYPQMQPPPMYCTIPRGNNRRCSAPTCHRSRRKCSAPTYHRDRGNRRRCNARQASSNRRCRRASNHPCNVRRVRQGRCRKVNHRFSRVNNHPRVRRFTAATAVHPTRPAHPSAGTAGCL